MSSPTPSKKQQRLEKRKQSEEDEERHAGGSDVESNNSSSDDDDDASDQKPRLLPVNKEGAKKQKSRTPVAVAAADDAEGEDNDDKPVHKSKSDKSSAAAAPVVPPSASSSAAAPPRKRPASSSASKRSSSKSKSGSGGKGVKLPLAERKGTIVLDADELAEYDMVHRAADSDEPTEERRSKLLNNKSNGDIFTDANFDLEKDVFVLRHKETGAIVWALDFCVNSTRSKLGDSGFLVPTGAMLMNHPRIKQLVTAREKTTADKSLPADTKFADDMPLPQMLITYRNTPSAPRASPTFQPDGPKRGPRAASSSSSAVPIEVEPPRTQLELAMAVAPTRVDLSSPTVAKELREGMPRASEPQSLAQAVTYCTLGMISTPDRWVKNVQGMADGLWDAIPGAAAAAPAARRPSVVAQCAALKAAKVESTEQWFKQFAQFDAPADPAKPPQSVRALVLALTSAETMFQRARSMIETVVKECGERVSQEESQRRVIEAAHSSMAVSLEISKERVAELETELAEARADATEKIDALQVKLRLLESEHAPSAAASSSGPAQKKKRPAPAAAAPSSSSSSASTAPPKPKGAMAFEDD